MLKPSHSLPVFWVLLNYLCTRASADFPLFNAQFPSGYCNKNGQPFPFKSDSTTDMRIAAQMTQHLKNICRLRYLFLKEASETSAYLWQNDSTGLLNVFGQASDMRLYCRLSAKKELGKTWPGDWRPGGYMYKTNCHRNSTSSYKAWDHLTQYKFQTCVLLYLMCLCCYVYGRIMALDISPIAKLRRLNWTKENFIWAYKNF